MLPLRIFISYGRDQYAPLAARLAEDLTAKGYEDWYDQQLQSGRPWARDIQKQLRWLVEVPENGRFIFLLTQHSTRDNSFCLSELQFALDNHVPVIPILVEDCEIPIEIYPLQRLDLRPCLPVEEHPLEYNRLLNTLVADMEGQIESRLAQQKIIANIAPQNIRNQPPGTVPSSQEIESPVSSQQSLPVSRPEHKPNPYRSALKSRWVWVFSISFIALLVIGMLWQNQVFTAAPRPSQTAPITPTRTRSVQPPLPTLTLGSTAKPPVTPVASQTLPITPTRPALPSPTSTLVPPACTGIGQTWKSPVDGMTLVCVPAGEFLMGSTETDKDATSNEKPQHKVYLDAYWMDQFEVTSAMYADFLNQKGNQTEGGSSWYYYTYGSIEQVNGIWRTYPGYEQYPVTGVSWYGAKAYCAWAGRQLPGEAQWEKAARGTDNRLYPWGNQTPNNTLANYQEARGNTTAVKSYESGKNPYGLYDMAGNVWEWVEDWYGETYYQSVSTWRNPTGPVSGSDRILRGGCCFSGAGELRTAWRSKSAPDSRDGVGGFRCAR